MPDEKQIRRYESMLFDYGTVQRTDYRGGEIIPQPKIKVLEETPPKPRVKDHVLKDTQTLTDRRPISFDLFIRAKDIVRTDPRMVQRHFSKPEDQGRLEAQKTRPRLVMTPAVSMDDIEDQRTRDLLIKDVYLSTVRKATEEGVALTKYKTVRAPLPGLPAPAHPKLASDYIRQPGDEMKNTKITIPKLNAPYVSPEWRMDSVSWDNRQLRAHCDPTKQFWLARTPKCSVCDATAARKAQKMTNQMRRRSLI